MLLAGSGHLTGIVNSNEYYTVESGISIVMVSSDLPELLAISDRVLVVSNGKITGEFDRDEMSEEAVMRAAIK